MLPLAAAVLLLALLAGLARDSAFDLPRGDVAIDAGVAASLAEGRGVWTPWERGSPYRLDVPDERFGHPADQHPPLWPLFGSVFIRLFGANPSQALNWASFAAHLGILMMMVLLGRRLDLGPFTPLPAFLYAIIAVGCAFSFNGSLYTGQALLYLLAAWFMAKPAPGIFRSVLLGALMGAAFLLNYQAAILLPVFLAVRFIVHRQTGRQAARLLETAAALLAAAAATAPWLIRNAALFGNPFYSVNPFYVLSKAGAPISHRIVEGRLILEQASLPASALAKGLLGCAWLNIPFLLLLLLALYPGCMAALSALSGSSEPAARSRAEPALRPVLAILLLLHLAVCLAWPALKVRFLVPAGPVILLLAWASVRESGPVRRGRILVITGLAGLFCAAVWLKGSLHGRDLAIAFLLSFLPMILVLLYARTPRSTRGSAWWPPACLALLLLSGAGTWPGGAYFNVPPCPDFFGMDKDRAEAAGASDLRRAAKALEEMGADRVIGDLRLWHASPGLRVVTPPLRIPGENYGDILRHAARKHDIRYAVLERSVLAREPALASLERVFEGEAWIIVDMGGW